MTDSQPSRSLPSAEPPAVHMVEFQGSQLATLEHEGERWVALKPVVEGIGMSWGSQHTKLDGSGGRFNHTDIGTVGADGRQREMTCIPLRRYPMWLATINPAKIPNPAVRQRVELFEETSTPSAN